MYESRAYILEYELREYKKEWELLDERVRGLKAGDIKSMIITMCGG